jgi:predicted small secreted protein
MKKISSINKFLIIAIIFFSIILFSILLTHCNTHKKTKPCTQCPQYTELNKDKDER